MASTRVELIGSQEVAASTEESFEYTPANGKKFIVDQFFGDGAFSQNVVVKLVWDYGGGAEQVLWTIKGSSQLPPNKTFELTGNGTKKLALALDNGASGPVYISGFIRAWVED
jgi:hypothetical protein